MKETINRSDIIITGIDEYKKRKKQEIENLKCRYKKQKKWKVLQSALIVVVALILIIVMYKVITGKFGIIIDYISNWNPILIILFLGFILLFFSSFIYSLIYRNEIFLYKGMIKEIETRYNESEKSIKKLIDGTATIDKIEILKSNIATVYLYYINEQNQLVEADFNFHLKFSELPTPNETYFLKIDFNKKECTYFLSDLQPDDCFNAFGIYKINKERYRKQ